MKSMYERKLDEQVGLCVGHAALTSSVMAILLDDFFNHPLKLVPHVKAQTSSLLHPSVARNIRTAPA